MAINVLTTQPNPRLDPLLAVGDGVTDATSILSVAIADADGTVLDLHGLTYLVTTPISVTLTAPTTILNGRIDFNSTGEEQYALRLKTTSDLTVNNLYIDGNDTAAKLLYINANSAESDIVVESFFGENGLQTNTATSFAVGVQVSAETAGNTYNSVLIRNSTFKDFTSTKTDTGTLTTVGRGIYVNDSLNTIVTGCAFERIGPHQDGDGIGVSATNDSDKELSALLVANCTFIDCEKRSIKSQVANTIVSDVRCERTQVFTDNGSGQAEIALQRGGSVDGVLCHYADGAAPVVIVSLSGLATSAFETSPGSVRNVTVRCADNTDIIESIVGMNLDEFSDDYGPVVFENIMCGCLVQNVLFARNKQTDLSTITAQVTLRNIRFAGFSTATEAAYVFMTRGTASTFNVDLSLFDVISDSNYEEAFYKDTAPGSTTYLVGSLIEVSNTLVGTSFLPDVNSSPVKTYTFTVAENGTLTKTFTITSNQGAVEVKATYTSSRDALGNKLYTQGVIQASSARTYYNETIAGQKTSTQTGAIAISHNASAKTFTVSKTAGSTSSFGVLHVTLIDAGYIVSVT